MFDFLKKPVADLFVARPESATQQLVYRWPDQSIPNRAKLTVRADECVLFFKQGALVGRLEAGAHVIDSAHLPFLGDLIVSPLTNENHFITEVFFVRKTEHRFSVGPVKLGSFQDLASRLMVTLGFAAEFTVRATAPETLVTQLIGMSSDVNGELGAFLQRRIGSMLQSAVGRIAASEPVLQIASNQYSEELGQAVIERTRSEFVNDGIEVTRFLALDLRLDASSEAELRSFGGRLADLSVQREQADVGSQAGFAAYNLVKGQADLMRGVATGAAVHGLPALAPMGGVGLGGPMLTAAVMSSSHQGQLHPQRPAAQLTGGVATKYYLRGPGGVEGPYPPRQIALRAASLRLDADAVFVRLPGMNDWEIGADIPAIATELEKRLPRASAAGATGSPAAGAPSPLDAFERALSVAVGDKVLTSDEIELLSMLAQSASLAADASAARQYVAIRARALGCEIRDGSQAPAAPVSAVAPDFAASSARAAEPPSSAPSASAPGGPPPLRVGTVYIYDNGVQRTEGLSAKAVASRVKAAPDGVHMVWWNGAADWCEADGVEAIRAELKRLEGG